ncbi:MAG: hypothetical protein HZB51_33000 [Chloroflexi bacterium]|nr:hypothetical protein [Chloroflexota bacterium]
MTKHLGSVLGCGATLILVTCLLAIVAVAGGTPFSPGALSADHPQARPIQNFVSHADFETRCDLCHTPFHGPDAEQCVQCHNDVRDQITQAQGIHGVLRNATDCAACHVDHKGRTANLTRTSPDVFPHNQFGFSLINHQRDYNQTALTCRACHAFGQDQKIESANVRAACVKCHQEKDAMFIADHRKQMGEACVACHDGTDRLKDFDHATVFALDGKHANVACTKCHVKDRYRGTPTNCVACHADPKVHLGQFGTNCAACHTAQGWRPARLIKHSFPFDHGNKSKDSDCKVCHPTNYATNTCYSCHEHTQKNMATVHIKANIPDYQNCLKCHATGKKKE